MRKAVHRSMITLAILLTAISLAAATALAVGCVGKEEPLRISASCWIGYAPLFYVREKGWASGEIRIVPVSSLVESEKLFQAGMTDGFAGTQFEYYQGRTVSQTLAPAVLIDRSNGADVILSNVALDWLKQSDREATVYLEMQTVNSTLFSAFVREYGLSHVRFRKVNRDQVGIASADYGGDPTLLITYEPYRTELVDRGFFEIASTKDLSLLVLDAVFIDGDALARRPKAARALRDSVSLAIGALRENPSEFYRVVRPYLENQSYGDFLAGLAGIEWLVDGISPELRSAAEGIGVPTDGIAR